MSNLTDLLPAGAGGKQVSFVASGTIGNGVTVALKADGTVEVIAAVTQGAGSPTNYDVTAGANFSATSYDSLNNRIVVSYQASGNGNYGTSAVGTVSGTSITFGTPVVFSSAITGIVSSTFDSNSNKVVVAYENVSSGEYGTAIVGTVSGTSISFGSAVVFESAQVYWVSAAFDSASNKVVIAYLDGGNSSYGTAVVGTVSGTSISFGSPVVFETGQTQYISTTFDPVSNQVLIFYNDGNNGDYGTYAIGSVSGTSISFGSPALFKSGVARNISSAYDTVAQKVVISYRDNGNSGYGTALVGTVSGTALTFGAEVVFNSASTTETTAVYDVSAQKIVISYCNNGNSEYGTAIVGTVSGTSISFDSPLVLETVATTLFNSAYDSSSQKVIISYTDITSGYYGTSVVFTSPSTNSADFIGISDAAISDTASGSVTIKGGISTNVTGLTPNALYYVQADGVLASGIVPYSISGASYDSVSFSVATQDVTPAEMQFNDDGTKMYIMGYTDDIVFQYSLSSAYDMGTASYDSVNFDVTSQETEPTALAFNSDGTKMYIAGRVNDTVYQYTLATPFVVSSATYDSISFSVASQEGLVSSIAFKSDGTKMYVVGTGSATVFQYTLATPFVVSSATYDSVSFSISSNGGEANPTGLTFSEDGTKMFVIGFSLDAVLSYSLSSAWDLSTASYDSVSFSVASQDGAPQSVVFNATGNKFYIVGAAQGAIFQYSTSAASTTVLAGKALSSTSINLDYTT